jgi:hypothetical protein
MAMYLSPLVDVNEIDLSTTIPAVATSIGVIILRDTWKGPELKVQLVNSIDELIDIFGRPEGASDIDPKHGQSYEDLLAAAGFLQFGENLYCTRVLAPSATFAGVYGTVEELGGVSNSSSSTSNSSSSSCPFGSPTWETRFNNTYWEADEGGTGTWDGSEWDSVSFANFEVVQLVPLGTWNDGYRPTKMRIEWTPDIPISMFLYYGIFPDNDILTTNISGSYYGDVSPSGQGIFNIPEWFEPDDMETLSLSNNKSTPFSLTNVEFYNCSEPCVEEWVDFTGDTYWTTFTGTWDGSKWDAGSGEQYELYIARINNGWIDDLLPERIRLNVTILSGYAPGNLEFDTIRVGDTGENFVYTSTNTDGVSAYDTPTDIIIRPQYVDDGHGGYYDLSNIYIAYQHGSFTLNSVEFYEDCQEYSYC